MPELQENLTKEYLQLEFKRFTDFCIAALESNAFSEDAMIEIDTAIFDFKTKLDNLNTSLPDAEACIERLKEIKDTDFWDAESVLDLLDEKDVIEAAEGYAGYAVIKLSSISDTDKIIEFVNKEIYPYCIGGKSAFKLYE